MESRVKLLGHPVHPMLVVFPLGLLATAVIFDVVGLVSPDPDWGTVSYWMIAAGIVGGLLAAVFGLIDWLGISPRTRAKRIGAYHGVINVIVVGLFALSWFLRRDTIESPPALAQVFSFVGAGLALVSAWLGGELVDRLGIGVDPGAHEDAPSSLTHRSSRY